MTIVTNGNLAVGQVADRVYVFQEDIQRLETWVLELAVNAHVAIYLQNHDVVEGIVAATPTVQMFRDPDGHEGINGVVKLIHTHDSDWSALIWLGDIEQIRHLDSVTTGSSKA